MPPPHTTSQESLLHAISIRHCMPAALVPDLAADMQVCWKCWHRQITHHSHMLQAPSSGAPPSTRRSSGSPRPAASKQVPARPRFTSAQAKQPAPATEAAARQAGGAGQQAAQAEPAGAGFEAAAREPSQSPSRGPESGPPAAAKSMQPTLRSWQVRFTSVMTGWAPASKQAVIALDWRSACMCTGSQ